MHTSLYILLIIGTGWQTYRACEALIVNSAVKEESAALVFESV